MTPKEKAEELCMRFYSRIEHTLSEEYSPHERFITKCCALIAVDEILNQLNINNGAWDIKYWIKVKQEIEKL